MCGEKLVKGYARRSGTFQPHHHAVRSWFAVLRSVIVGSPKLRRKFMGETASRASVSKVLNSLETTLLAIEGLNPSVAGWGRPNCEYPWEIAGPPPRGYPPVRHRFGSAVGSAARAKVYRLIDRILVIEGV